MKYNIEELDLMRSCIKILYNSICYYLEYKYSHEYLSYCITEKYNILDTEELLRTFIINETQPIELYNKALKKLEDIDKKYDKDFDLNITKNNLDWYISKPIYLRK